MSSAVWIFVGLLLASPLYDATQIKEKFISRQRRSIVNLNSLVKAVTGEEGTAFVGYGKWCGLGGAGTPVDAIDWCCKHHDACYDAAINGTCKDYGKGVVYDIEYKWSTTDDGIAICDESEDRCRSDICPCKIDVCWCDAAIANCLKRHLHSYNPKNLHGIFNIFKRR